MIRTIVPGLILVGLLILSSINAWAQDDGELDLPIAETQEVVEDQPIEASEAADTPPHAPSILEPDQAVSQVDIDLKGRKTWTVRYGFGSPIALAPSGIQPGSLTLDQTLAVEVSGTILSILRIEARYDDQLSDLMQSIAIYLKTEQLDGVLGDFTFSAVPGFTTFMRTMKGLRLEYRLGDATITAVASRAQGSPESRVFIGRTARTDVSYRYWLDEHATTPAPYRQNLEGLHAFRLRALFAPDFSTLSFQFSETPQLRGVFADYDVAYLWEALSDRSQWELRAQDYRVLEAEEQVLLLRRDPVILVRERIRDLIKHYNEIKGLTGSDARSYPFVVGTEYEAAFLNAVKTYAELVVDAITYPFPSAEKRRFYSLGYPNVRSDTLRVDVSTDGRLFETVTAFGMPEYRVIVHEADGIIECDFPEEFYMPTSVLRVSFDYVATEGAFMLELSLIPGSERVILNGEVLRKDADYMLDYELGMLTLLVEFGDEDVLQVDYERYTGGFGAASDYATQFYGLLVDLPVSSGLNLRGNILRRSDVARATANPETIDTMPNQHTVAGIEARISLDDLSATLLLGYNHDVFPFDDNERQQALNEIRAIASGNGYVLFGHRRGLTVHDEGDWGSYTVGSGLPGRIVQSIALHNNVVYLGTENGLAIVQLEGASPFDRAANWTQRFVAGELPSASIGALAVWDDSLWIGTENGLVEMSLEDPHLWQRHQGGEFDSIPPITAMAASRGTIILGTVRGVYLFDTDQEEVRLLPGTEGDAVHDLYRWTDEVVYVASNRGLRAFSGERSTGWVVLSEPVYAVQGVGDVLYLGTRAGVRTIDQTGLVVPTEAAVLALARSPEGLWVGGRATDTHEMPVFLLSQRVNRFPEEITGISGRDPRTFVDAKPSEHTVTGWIARASFSQSTDRYTVSGRAEWLPFGFRALGSRSRSDATGWAMAGQFSLGSTGQLHASHDYRLTGLQSESTAHRMENNLRLSWTSTFGPRWTVSVTQTEDAGRFPSVASLNHLLSTSVSVQDTFFRDSLSMNVQWTRQSTTLGHDVETALREGLSLSYNWKLSNDMTIAGVWSRPVQRVEDRFVGTERFESSWTWKPSLSLGELLIASMDLRFTTNWRRSMTEEHGLWDHRGAIGVNMSGFDLASWRVQPDLKLEANHAAASTDLRSEIISRWIRDNYTVRTSLRGQLLELGRPVFHQVVDWSASLRYAGSPDLDPSMTYTGSRRVAVKGIEKALTSTDALTGRLVWSPKDGPRNDLSVSLQLRGTVGSESQLTGSLDNRLTADLSPLLAAWFEPEDSIIQTHADVRWDTKATVRLQSGSPDVTFSSTVDLQVSWPPNWSVSLASTYSAGLRPVIGFYQGVLFELTFAISF